MARQDAFPSSLGRVHPRCSTPHVSTILIGVIAASGLGCWASLENFVYDSLTSLSLMIAFYYALYGFRLRDLLPARADQVGEEAFIGVGPVVGGTILGYPRQSPSTYKRRPVLLGQRSGSRCRWCSAWGCCCSAWS